MSSSNCLVTGGAGFIGSHLIGKLLGSGHRVVCLDNFDDYYDVSIKKANIHQFLSDPDFTLVHGDILDREVLGRCVSGADHIFHLAGRPGVRASIEEPLRAQEVNATGTLLILDMARNNGVKKVIFASSSSVYGIAVRLPLAESDATHPLSPYAASKLCAENYCEIYRSIYGLDTVSLRYFTVFGPRMRPDLAISIFTRSALAGKDIVIFGDGGKSRDFTYIDNVVDANVRAMDHGSGIYNIGGSQGITIGELAKAIVEMTGSSSRIKFQEDAAGDMEHTLADITKARDELGYRPSVDIREGLERYIDHVREEQRHANTKMPVAYTV